VKCTVEDADFRPAWKAMLPPNAADHLDAWDDQRWLTELIRLEADNDSLTLVGPYARATIPAQVERRGVVFFPIRNFIDGTANLYGDTHLEINATDEYFASAHGRQKAEDVPLAVFDDPATAPETWVPPPKQPDDDDWFEDEPEETDAPKT